VEDFFRTGLSPALYSTQQLALALKKQRNQIDRLVHAVVIEMGKESDSTLTFQELFTSFECSLSAFYGNSILDLYEQIAPSFKKMTSPALLTQVKHFDSLLASGSCTPEQFDFFLKDAECFLEKFTLDNLKKKAAMPSLGPLESMKRTLLPLIETASDTKKIIQRMAKECKKAWEKKDLYTPDRLLTAMQQALKEPLFVERVRKRYRAAIVDEFQDTDPIQWEIFQTLFLSEEAPLSAVYLVGDPKQSIYAFRKADIYTYLAAQELLGADAVHHLDTNFRSDAPLIQGLNTLFSAAHWITLPTANKILPYHCVKASARNPDRVFNDDKGSVHFFCGSERNFLPFIVSEIQALKDQQIAILVKDRYQAE
ncbi:MAG TPA: UvrD-helicase domain-containing protein, partial [Rhabdochlamydiaceae bacterium]